MNMQNVKEIQIPDSRYRQLEYIHFSGAEALNCWYQFLSGTTYKRIDMRCRYLVNNNWGSSGFYSSSNNKMLLGVNNNGKTQFAVGSRYVYNTSDLISIDTTNFYTWALWSNNGNCDLSIYRDAEETDLVGKTNTYSYTFNANSGRFYVGAYNNNGTLTGYATMDIAYVILRADTYSNIVFNGIPCQRKADGVCGLYDSISGLFWPMEGTEITTNAAGTTVNENMPIYVKKIESNNQTIWGSASAFPYRKLEYIHFSGAEYIDTTKTLPTGTTYKRFDLTLSWQDTSNWGVNGFDSTTNNRFNMGVNGSGYARFGSGSTATYQDSDGYNISLNTKYDWLLWASGGNTNLSVWQDGVNIWTSTNRTTTFSSAPGNVYIGASLYNGAVSSFTKENVYKAVLRTNNVDGIIFNGIPVQRKSDNVCGLYDTINNSFYPMQGTSVTSGAAGPTVDEYWDLQA